MKKDTITHIKSIIDNNSLDHSQILKQIKLLLLDNDQEDIVYNGSKSLSDLVSENLIMIQKSSPDSNLVKTGFRDLDAVIGGFSFGEFIVVGGRPSMGKTQFLVSLSLNISEKHPILYFTYDLSPNLLTNRFISALTNIPVNKIIQNDISDSEKIIVESVKGRIDNYKVFIDDTCNNSISEMRSIVEKHIKENGIRMVIVDFLQMMSTDKYRNSRELEISYISRELKNIAKDNGICMIASSQLNRSVENRGGNKRPYLSDLRDSGAIEQDADKVIFIHRPEYYGFMENEDGDDLSCVVELIIAKNRNGKVDNALIRRDKDFTSFTDYTKKATFSFLNSRLDEINSPF